MRLSRLRRPLFANYTIARRAGDRLRARRPGGRGAAATQAARGPGDVAEGRGRLVRGDLRGDRLVVYEGEPLLGGRPQELPRALRRHRLGRGVRALGGFAV